MLLLIKQKSLLMHYQESMSRRQPAGAEDHALVSVRVLVHLVVRAAQDAVMDAPQRAQEDVLMDVQHLVVDVQAVAFPVAHIPVVLDVQPVQ